MLILRFRRLLSLDVTPDSAQRYFQRHGQLRRDANAHLHLPEFDRTDVRPVNPRLVGEILLRQA